MKSCPFCQAEIENTARFCLHCMTSLEEKEVWQAPRRMNTRWQGFLGALVSLALLVGTVWLSQKHFPELPVIEDIAESTAESRLPETTRETNTTGSTTALPAADPQTVTEDAADSSATTTGRKTDASRSTGKTTATGRTTAKATTTKKPGFWETLFGKKTTKSTTTTTSQRSTTTRRQVTQPSASTGRSYIPTTTKTAPATTTTKTTTVKPTTTTKRTERIPYIDPQTTTTTTKITATTTKKTTTTTAKPTTTTTKPTTTTTKVIPTRFPQTNEIITTVEDSDTVSTYLKMTDVQIVPGKTSKITLKNINSYMMPDPNSWVEYTVYGHTFISLGTRTFRVFPIRPGEEETFTFYLPEEAAQMKLSKCNVNLVAESYLDSYFDMFGWD